jgi:hypothetical protein
MLVSKKSSAAGRAEDEATGSYFLGWRRVS